MKRCQVMAIQTVGDSRRYLAAVTDPFVNGGLPRMLFGSPYQVLLLRLIESSVRCSRRSQNASSGPLVSREGIENSFTYKVVPALLHCGWQCHQCVCSAGFPSRSPFCFPLNTPSFERARSTSLLKMLWCLWDVSKAYAEMSGRL